jgi:Tfp pilus assembly protein PilF
MINFLRTGSLALATLAMSLMPAVINAASRGPIIVAFQEESIPAADLAQPSSAASPSALSPPTSLAPATDSNPDSSSWERVPTPRSAPAAPASPAGFQAVSAPASAVPAVLQPPAEIPPAMDVGAVMPTPQISDSSLEPLINAAPTPGRAASLRITEKQRVELEKGHVDDAVRELAHAVSIDPSNSYAYFYLGRAYVARKGYAQALTFFKRAEIGLASNSAWLGEIYAFEGLSLEQSGKSSEAEAAYQKALAATPGNLTARVGATRLAAFAPAPAAPAPVADAAQTAPDAVEVPPPPAEAPPPPAPAPASMPSPTVPTDD